MKKKKRKKKKKIEKQKVEKEEQPKTDLNPFSDISHTKKEEADQPEGDQ